MAPFWFQLSAHGPKIRTELGRVSKRSNATSRSFRSLVYFGQTLSKWSISSGQLLKGIPGYPRATLCADTFKSMLLQAAACVATCLDCCEVGQGKTYEIFLPIPGIANRTCISGTAHRGTSEILATANMEGVECCCAEILRL